jgi:trans-aconitate 2-methyltransferase
VKHCLPALAAYTRRCLEDLPFMATADKANWDASRYHRVAQPHAAWGASVLDRLQLRGDETVLDAGCGSGRVTAQLLERLPRGHVIAADHSPAMLAQARQVLAPWAGQVTFVEVDLLQLAQEHLAAPAPVEVVLSTAVFHWIADHPRLFKNLYAVLKQPAGYLEAQCGGGANLAEFMRATDTVVARPPFAALLQGLDLWRHCVSAEQAEADLRAAGFATATAWLEESPQTFADAAALADYCRGVVLTSHVAALPPALADDFVAQVVAEIARRSGGFVLDYVRLNLRAAV